MANLNRVLLIGNLTRDPELRYTPGGAAVAEFGLATNRQWRNQSGEMQEETTFVDIVVWGRQAETSNEYLSKGRSVFIEGRLTYDSWENQDGQRRSKLRVTAERVQFLGGRPEGGSGGGGGGGGGGGSRGGGQQHGGSRSEGPPRRQPDRPPQQPPAQQPPRDDDLNLDDIPF